MSEFRFLINGEMRTSDRTMTVINPATGAAFVEVPRAGPKDVDAAVAAASKAFPNWAATDVSQRRKVLLAMAAAVEARADELAKVLTQEQGKPLQFAQIEISDMVGFLRFYAECPMPGETIEDSEVRVVRAVRRPLGVVAAIVPWNFPLALMASKVAPALLMGNTVVVKPAGTTPAATLLFGEIVREHVPAGVLNIIADANDLGAALTGHSDVRKVSFTGSTATGRQVMASAADGLKRVTLELGGNDAAIVLDDVDPAQVAEGLFMGAFFNSGQVCIAIKRLYVQRGVYDELCDALSAIADNIPVGNGMDEGIVLGPVQNRAQYEKVKDLIASGASDGKLIAGSDQPDGDGYFIRPTIIRDIASGTRLVDEEQFGPVLPVIVFDDVEDAIAQANASVFGLGGSIWSADIARARSVAEQIEAGAVWINKHMDVAPNIPFAGAKSSGVGVEWGETALAEYGQYTIINEPA